MMKTVGVETALKNSVDGWTRSTMIALRHGLAPSSSYFTEVVDNGKKYVA
jgi:hypothetical protein